MDSFLDTGIIVSASEYRSEEKNKANQKSWNYIKNKRGEFIVCLFTIEEIKKLFIKKTLVAKEVISKLNNPLHEIGSIFHPKATLKKHDIEKAKQIYLKFKENNIKNSARALNLERSKLISSINIILERYIDKKVIPIEQIDNNIASILNDIIENINDCNIFASAIQHQKEKDLFLFVTIDKRDFNPNNYDYLKEYLDTNKKLTDYKLPKLKNLLFE